MGGRLDDPDAPGLPSSADWNIARSLGELGISFDTIQLVFIRRIRSTSDTYLPPIRSLAYFRAVALNLSRQERDPAYFDYVQSLYEELRASHPEASADTPLLRLARPSAFKALATHFVCWSYMPKLRSHAYSDEGL